MKDIINKKGELIGYETKNQEIHIHGNINHPDEWLVTIRSLDIFGKPLYCSKSTDIEFLKDKVYAILDSKEIVIENLKKMLSQ